MKSHKRVSLVVVGVAIILTLGVAVRAAKQAIPLSQARIYIEFNATANDLGFHIFLDGEDWRSIQIAGPNGKKLFSVKGGGGFGKLGMTELFFEGAEPSLDDVPLEELLALFPEGEYEFVGKTVDGDKLVGTATLTHNVPDGPVIVSPDAGEVVDPADVVIEWNPVTTPLGIQIAGYQVIVERQDPRRVLNVDLPATATSMKVPPEFLEPGTPYIIEVLAKEVGGNQTLTEGSFETE